MLRIRLSNPYAVECYVNVPSKNRVELVVNGQNILTINNGIMTAGYYPSLHTNACIRAFLSRYDIPVSFSVVSALNASRTSIGFDLATGEFCARKEVNQCQNLNR